MKVTSTYVMIRRLQSDPIQNRSSRYRSMSGDRFLVSLREVLTYERILSCRSLLKVRIDTWNNKEEENAEDVQNFLSYLDEHRDDIIMDAYLSDVTKEVSELVTSYIVRHILRKSDCEECKAVTISEKSDCPPKIFLREVPCGALEFPFGVFFFLHLQRSSHN